VSDIRHAARLGWLAVRSPGCFTIARRSIASYGAIQRTSELASALRHVAELRPRAVVEIGSHAGGTLHAWSAVSAADAAIISVDLESAPRDRLPARRGQRMISIRGDSHDPDTLARLRDALAARPVDFLFVDGDHSYAGVRLDFLTYAPLVRIGGLVALHDIVEHPGRPDCDVWRFWQELRGQGPTHECVDVHGRRHGGMGIGLLRVTEAGRRRWLSAAI
jgi:cephalosporin hydroxylase